MLAAGAKDIADSTQLVEALSVKGTVVAEPTPSWYSLHPWAALLASHPLAPAATVVYPAPTVYFVAPEAVSTFPTTSEFEAGVKEATEADVEPPADCPVDVCKPVLVTPLTS